MTSVARSPQTEGGRRLPDDRAAILSGSFLHIALRMPRFGTGDDAQLCEAPVQKSAERPGRPAVPDTLPGRPRTVHRPKRSSRLKAIRRGTALALVDGMETPFA